MAQSLTHPNSSNERTDICTHCNPPTLNNFADANRWYSRRARVVFRRKAADPSRLDGAVYTEPTHHRTCSTLQQTSQPTHTQDGQEGRRCWREQQEGCRAGQKGRGCSQQEGGRGQQEGCSRRRRMVKGLEEGQRQKVSLPNLCCPSIPPPRTVFGPFHPSASFLPLVFSRATGTGCLARGLGSSLAGGRLTRDVSHLTNPSGPAYHLTSLPLPPPPLDHGGAFAHPVTPRAHHHQSRHDGTRFSEVAVRC